MIQSDQPTIFKDRITVGLSSQDDGNMKFSRGDDDQIRYNRETFLYQVGIDPTQSTLLQVSYDDTTDFTRYAVIDDDYQGQGMLEPTSDLVADGLVVNRPNHALFLPLADCAGAVIYDPENRVLMVSHLGRHSIEQQGAVKSINYLVQQFGSHPQTLEVWLSPMVGADTYPLRMFDDRSLLDVVVEQLLAAGVSEGRIEVCAVDTAESDNYFSHSQYLEGAQLNDDRFAIVAMMHD